MTNINPRYVSQFKGSYRIMAAEFITDIANVVATSRLIFPFAILMFDVMHYRR